MAEVLEAVMLICFGLSWPLNAYKKYKAGTAVGTSWQFILLITLGYVAGIAAKFASGQVNWVLIVYFLNLLCIGANWVVYFRDRALDAERGRMRNERMKEDLRATGAGAPAGLEGAAVPVASAKGSKTAAVAAKPAARRQAAVSKAV